MSADQELARRVQNYLWGRQVPSLRRVAVESNQGVVTLRGQVRSFYEKQLCHQSCRRVAGVIGLVDEIDVQPTAELAGV
jgi:osmotically-inducible protein OsmY